MWLVITLIVLKSYNSCFILIDQKVYFFVCFKVEYLKLTIISCFCFIHTRTSTFSLSLTELSSTKRLFEILVLSLYEVSYILNIKDI